VAAAIGTLKDILRDYQLGGVEWMARLAARGLGGILADEMGLGKTLQSLALVLALRRLEPGKPALVICPKSLLGNWAAEAGRFTPSLRVRMIRGAGRQHDLARLDDADLVITSYQMFARDIEHHAARTWAGVILDEASFIRNPDTQVARALRRLDARARFALSGTPIENSVRDLWSLMEFCLPGYLGSRADFRDRYENALVDPQNAARVLDRLRRRMRPYWLRRVKSDVVRELPDKIEKVILCEMNDSQTELYSKLLREGSEKVIEAERQKSPQGARMTILTALLRLRQTCCDPRLLRINLTPEARAQLPGKTEALAELLDEIASGGHNALIFSQFASMLHLLRETVSSSGLEFCHLDGSTVSRDTEIESFRNDPNKRVFLISLKAGGFGLNLTKADTVIHFDPWWNPAVEAQATDRAHRIGQSRPVTVYKLIATGTVEEKILRLQKRKRALMDAALDDSEPLMDGLGDDELRQLMIGD
jgi:SNF2 family DNA or RNA helicase